MNLGIFDIFKGKDKKAASDAKDMDEAAKEASSEEDDKDEDSSE